MNNKDKAQRLLYEMNKGFADSPYVDMPAGSDASPEQQMRAKEGNESLNSKDRKEQRSIELTRYILSIDSEKYDVDLTMSNALAGYIERNPETALKDIKMELGQRIKDYYKTAQKIKALKADNFATEMDFLRAKNHEIKGLKAFENRIEYVKRVVSILEMAVELNAEEEEHRKVVEATDDFDFSYMHSHGNNGYQNLG